MFSSSIAPNGKRITTICRGAGQRVPCLLLTKQTLRLFSLTKKGKCNGGGERESERARFSAGGSSPMPVELWPPLDGLLLFASVAKTILGERRPSLLLVIGSPRIATACVTPKGKLPAAATEGKVVRGSLRNFFRFQPAFATHAAMTRATASGASDSQGWLVVS